ncbi:MAG: hypothetical protein KDC44_13315, partial [Phaeodactylibacter sp.]|nr:hypothetical protein [Phaeodactylibacter sp.]
NITPGIAGWPSRWLSGIQVDHSNSNIIYVTFMGFNNSASGNSDHVWRGEFDPVGGVWSWALIASGLPDVPVGGIVKHSGTGDLYIATDIGVFMSDDDGTSWTPFEAGLPNVPVVDLHLDEASNTLRAATHGRGMYRVKLYTTCPEVDLYLRDNILDTGEVTPSPSGVADPTQPGNVVRFYKSADIKVDAPPFDTVDALTDGVEFDNPDHPFGAVYIESIDGIEHNQPIRTQINRVYLQIHNRGWQTANSVTVKLLWADAGAGLPALPADYWSNWSGDGFDQTNWHPLGTTTITNLEPNVPVVLSRNWTPPASVSTHVCLLAMLDSPQDPLLPQTATNVDFLTRNNKKITHRNTHPIDPPAPGTGPAWMGLNFNNAWGEYQFFRFEIKPNGGRIPPLKVFFVDPEPAVFEGIKAKGLRKADLDRQGLEREVKNARGYDRLSDADVDRLLGAKELICFEVEPLPEAAFLDRVWLPPYGQVRAYFMQDFSREQDAPLAAFEVNQYLKDELIGGSEYVVAKKQPEATEGCKEQLIRIVLEKVEILDDKDRGIFGKGEIVLFSEVKINGSLDRGKQLRFPERGCYRISDKPGQNQQEIDRVLFEGCVCADDLLTIDIYGTEHDIDLIGDDFERYHRVFSGNPGSYLGQYTPHDQSPDPEKLKDWMVWYRIERVS